MKTFKEFVSEDVSVGGGALGPAAALGHGGTVGNSDFYASGDSRVPFALGAKKIKKSKSKKTKILVQRRPLVNN